MHTRSYFVSVASAMAFFASAGFCQAADPGAAPGSNSPSNAAQAAVTTPRGQALGASTATQQLSLKAMLDSYKPYPTPQLSALPQEAHSLIDPLAADNTAAPKIIAGMPGPKTVERAAGVAEPAIAASDVAQNSITPFDYGRTSLSTVYHYTDRLLDSELADDFPYRTVGWLVFVASNGGSYRCTAQLIGRSIGVTAGHCVHDGGNKAAGWIRSATFYPGYPYLGMSAPVYWVNTTSGWYNNGNLDAGYDVGVFTLRKRTGTSVELGASTGYVSFCTSNCLQKYWYLTQLGYPGNYYSGTYMTQGNTWRCRTPGITSTAPACRAVPAVVGISPTSVISPAIPQGRWATGHIATSSLRPPRGATPTPASKSRARRRFPAPIIPIISRDCTTGRAPRREPCTARRPARHSLEASCVLPTQVPPVPLAPSWGLLLSVATLHKEGRRPARDLGGIANGHGGRTASGATTGSRGRWRSTSVGCHHRDHPGEEIGLDVGDDADDRGEEEAVTDGEAEQVRFLAHQPNGGAGDGNRLG